MDGGDSVNFVKRNHSLVFWSSKLVRKFKHTFQTWNSPKLKLPLAEFIAVMDKTKNEDSSAVAKAKTESDARPRKLCAYSQRVCNLEILKGFDFCHKHILEDKASPFKPCDFVAKSNGKRCPNPAQKLPDRAKR